MPSPIVRVSVPLDAVLDTFQVVAPGDFFHGVFNVEAAPAGISLFFRFGRNGDPVLIPVGAGAVDECEVFSDGLFMDSSAAVAGGFAVIQIAKAGISNAN